MKSKNFLLMLLALFSATCAFGQNSLPDNLPAPRGKLLIKHNSRYFVGTEKFTRAEVLEFIESYPDVTAQIRRGVKLRRTAMGVGFTGLGLILGGASLLLGELGGSSAMFGDSDNTGMWIGIGAMSIGGLMGFASIGVCIAGRKAQKKAMRLYNEQAGYADLPIRDLCLSLAPTRGGLGLQLNF